MRRLHNAGCTELSPVGLVQQTYGRKLSNTRSDEDLVMDRILKSNFVIHRIKKFDLKKIDGTVLHTSPCSDYVWCKICTMGYEVPHSRSLVNSIGLELTRRRSFSFCAVPDGKKEPIAFSVADDSTLHYIKFRT
jgi:hypothetical protein